MSNVTGNVNANVNATQVPSTGFLNGQQLPIQALIKAAFKAAGTVADKVNLVHAKTYTMVASTPQTLDLTTLTDILGAAINFARVRVVAIKVKSTNDSAILTVKANASNGWTNFATTGGFLLKGSSLQSDGVTINNDGGCLFIAPNTTGYAVGSSNKALDLSPSAHAFDVDVVILGCDA